MLVEAFMDALVDSAKILPLLFVIYVLIEVIEHRYGSRMDHAVGRAGKAGPALGALLGSIPQCGFSVMGTALYNQRLITVGTLLAIYLSTSDEAIPIMLSDPSAAATVIPLLLCKIVIAVVFGYLIDLVFHKVNVSTLEHIKAYDEGTDDVTHDHTLSEKACCGHVLGDEEDEAGKHGMTAREILLHPLRHTLKIFAFILVVTFLINLLFAAVGEDAIAAALAAHPMLQPFVAALVGLIPNCAASVAITEFYLKGIITFGATIAGLCASGGLGLLVLLKEERDKSRALQIICLLFAVSVFVGILVDMVGIV